MKFLEWLARFNKKTILLPNCQVRLLIYGFIIAFVFFLPYFLDFWWKFAFSTSIIFLFAHRIWRQQWRYFLGLTIPARDILICAALFGVLFFGFRILIFYQLRKLSIQFHGVGLIWCLAVIFQVLNEEIILRAILLRYTSKLLNSANLATFLTAAIFSSLHFLFYNIAQGVHLSNFALIALFFFWLISNRLFLTFNHIGFSYIFHLAWNLTRFTSEYFYHNQKISEGSLFNQLEGSPVIVVTLMGLYLVVFLLTRNKRLA